MTKYWIKLYHETLHDPKMGLLPDRLYRRTIELFLIAGEQDDEGYLPPIEEIAWTLRQDVEQLETEMIELQRKGILSMVDGRWLVTNFAKRQAPMDKAEYMRRKRAEETQEQYQGVTNSVTSGNTDTDTDTDIDIDKNIEEEGGAYADMRDMLERMTGLPSTPGDIKAIEELTKLGAQEDDIAGALQWRKENGRAGVKTIAQLLPGIKTNYSIRVQNGNAKPLKKKRKNAGTLAAARERLEHGNSE